MYQTAQANVAVNRELLVYADGHLIYDEKINLQNGGCDEDSFVY